MTQLATVDGPDNAVNSILMGVPPPGADQTEEEQNVVKEIYKMLAEAKKHGQIWAKDHARRWDLWEGNHYKNKRPHTLSQAIVNQIWSAVETFVAHLTDSSPAPVAQPRAPEFRDKAKLLSKWLKYISQENDLETELDHAVRSACVTGAGWLSIEWDQEADSNRGGVRFVAIDDKYIFVSPHARNLREALYVIEAKNVPRDFVIKTWEKGKDVTPGPRDPSLTNVRSSSNSTSRDPFSGQVAQFTTTTGGDSHWSSSNTAEGSRKSNLVTLVKAYIRKDDGTMWLTVLGNNVVLEDGPSPYDDDDFPYVVINVLPTLDTIQGRGMVQFIEGLQEVLNTTLSYLLDQQRFCSDPMMIVDGVNLEEGQLIENSPGAILPNLSPDRQGYQWLQAPGFNQAWLQIHEVITNYMDSVLGRVEIIRGEHPAGVDTLGGLEVLRDEANIRLRKHIKWVKASLKRAYLLAISRLRQFAQGERLFRINGKFGQDEFVQVNPITGANPDGSMQQDLTIPENAEFEIAFGLEVPGGRQAKIELALQLMQTPGEDGLPLVDRQYVLEQAEVEEAPEIMGRIAQIQQAQMQAQQQAEGVPPPEEEENPDDTILSYFTGMG